MSLVLLWQRVQDQSTAPMAQVPVELVVFGEQFVTNVPAEVPPEPTAASLPPSTPEPEPQPESLPPTEPEPAATISRQLAMPEPPVEAQRTMPPQAKRPVRRERPSRTKIAKRKQSPKTPPRAIASSHVQAAPVVEKKAVRAFPVVNFPRPEVTIARGTTPPAAEKASLRAHYKAKLLARIEKNKHYPNRARRRRIEGEVRVRFTILKDGEVRDVVLDRSSGSEVLDKAALEVVMNLTRVDPLPLKLGMDRWTMIVPLRFKLLR